MSDRHPLVFGKCIGKELPFERVQFEQEYFRVGRVGRLVDQANLLVNIQILEIKSNG